MKKRNLILIMGMFLISLVSAGFVLQKTVSLRDSSKIENIMDYTVVWGETDHITDSCYLVLNNENNELTFESKISDNSIINCQSGKGIEIMFNAIQELEQESNLLKSELCLKDLTYSWCK